MKTIDNALRFTDGLGNIIEDCEEHEVCADYVINVGEKWGALEPIDSAYTKEEAIAKARATKAKIQEVVYSPALDPDYPDYVVWRNKTQKIKCCHYCGRGCCEIPVYQECDGKDEGCKEFENIY